MKSERWEQVKDVLSASLELAPEERSEYLSRACGGDVALIEEVQSLLASYEQANTFLDKPALGDRVPQPDQLARDPGPAVRLIGSLIGPYRIERIIGQGGMGTVYLGAREDGEFTMRVAIKVIRQGLDSEQRLRRFRLERQILAKLSHPNIARLLDGGVTGAGLTYFVMEYVDGTPLDQYVREHDLSLHGRLELFRSVCAAVQYAHQNLVVHSDLKASNVVVTAEGVPKLLDFGVARLLEPDLADANRPASMLALTPDYASPEQLRGQAVTTSSDGYSLGVILFEILAGRRPHSFACRSPSVICQIIDQTDPPLPSVTAGDARMRGDLDAIVLKAMHRDPARRYNSIEQLSEDLARHMELQPVLARPHTPWYKASRFVRRNTALVAVAATLVISLVAGLGATLWQAHVAQAQRDRAQQRFEEIRKLAGSFILQMDDSLAPLAGSLAAREALVKRSLEYLDRLASEAGDDPGIQQDLAGAYQKLGDVQGGQGASNLGNTSAALDSYGKALSIRRVLAGRFPNDPRHQRSLADIYSRMSGVLKIAGDYRAGLDFDRRALAIRQTLTSKDPDNWELRRSTAQTLNALGASLSHVGEWTEALAIRRQAVTAFEELVKADPANVADRRALALAHSRLGSILMREGDGAAALRHCRRSVEIEAALVAGQPGDTQIRSAAGISYNTLGRVLARLGNLEEAAQSFSKALAIFEEVVAADPKDARARSLLAASHDLIGTTLVQRESPQAALTHLKKSLVIRETVSKENPINAGARGEVAESNAALGDAYLALEKRGDALTAYRTALNQLQSLRREGRSNSSSDETYDRMRKIVDDLTR